MRRILISLALLFAISLLYCQAASAITISTVPVGNPGNMADPANSGFFPGIGSVSYSYNIGQYDVTVGQYTAFLNAVAATDTYGLYNPNMATDLTVAGISQNGSSGSYTYSVIGSANHPITYVNWGDAARFANWLANGQPTGGETLSTTEDGSYFINGATTETQLDAITRKATATWVIPTQSEWYKAAYYNPATLTYYQYPYSSNTEPTSAPPGSAPNTGNFVSDSGAYAVTGSSTLDNSQNYLTDVGAYTASVSPYGAYDMGGDVWQWHEPLSAGSLPGSRGGAWDTTAVYISSLYSSNSIPTYETNDIGFRVALVPEPASFILLALVSLGLLRRLKH